MKKMTNVSAFSFRQVGKPFQRGLVLEVMFVILVAIFLAAMGLYRSVDTSTSVAGNLAFKRDAENRAQVALDEALTWIEDSTNYQNFIIDGVHKTDKNFSARMLATNSKGIPLILAGDPLLAFDPIYSLAPTAQMNDTSSGMRVRFVIERMCTQTGKISNDFCSVTSGSRIIKGSGTQPGGQMGGGTLRPLLRVSIRVDGPRDTVAYMQAMIDP